MSSVLAALRTAALRTNARKVIPARELTSGVAGRHATEPAEPSARHHRRTCDEFSFSGDGSRSKRSCAAERDRQNKACKNGMCQPMANTPMNHADVLPTRDRARRNHSCDRQNRARKKSRGSPSPISHRSTPIFSPRDRAGRKSIAQSRAFFILPVVDEIIDDGGIGERRGVAEIGKIIFRDLAQDAAHDFS